MTAGIRTTADAISDVENALNHLCRVENPSVAEAASIRHLARGARHYDAGAELCADGAPRSSCYVVSGWGCWRLDLSDGRRQIFGFIMPGDRIGDAALRVGCVVALTPISTIETTALAAVAMGLSPATHTHLKTGFGIDQDMLLDQIVRLGQLTAYERVAHLLLEIHGRLTNFGLGDECGMPFPLTQETLSNALGLSPVHLNRTLQRMRKEGLIELRASKLNLLRPHALAAICDYRLEDAREEEPITERRVGGVWPRASYRSPEGVSA